MFLVTLCLRDSSESIEYSEYKYKPHIWHIWHTSTNPPTWVKCSDTDANNMNVNRLNLELTRKYHSLEDMFGMAVENA